MIGGLNKSNNQDCEDSDRESLNLPYNQDKLILKLAKSNKNFIYINISGNAVAMPWKNDVGAILQTWYLGSEAGSSIASILSGDVNPSGKLPFSFAEKLDDYGAHHLSAYPGTKRDGSDYYDLEYSEGIFVGYRWFEKMDIKPLFPFGHGLSYTDFEYGKVTTDKTVIKDSETITFNINITNKGNRAGAEVVQLYISDKKSSLPRPKKELKGFKKIYLEKGETKTVYITIEKNQLSFYNDKISEWQCESGKFEDVIGSSTSDNRDKIEFVLK